MKHLNNFKKILCSLVLFGAIFVARGTNISSFTSATSTNANITKKLNLNAMTKVIDAFEAETSDIAVADSKMEESESQAPVQTPAPEQQAPVQQAQPQPAAITTVDASGYLNKPSMGFQVTTGNKTYPMSQEEFNVVAGVIGCEGSGENDRLAVASVIFNRADTGSTPYAVVSARGQFSCRSNVNSRTIALGTKALNAVQNGIRNNRFYGFNGRYSGYPYYIEDNGNRFHY